MTGVHSTCTLSLMHGVVSLSHPLCPLRTRILHPPCEQLLMAVVWGAGQPWSSSLIPSSLVHPYLSCSTPFHPMSNCSWQQFGVLHRAGFIISSPPSSLSTCLPLAPPHPLWWWWHLPGVAVIPHPSFAAVLGSCWCCVGFGSVMVFLLICREGVIISVVPVINEPC
jgi:hypothetical protein